MNEILEAIKKPWPWYVSGPLLGLIVPALLLAGNKSFGISSTLRHLCCICLPGKIEFLNYDWKKEVWNLVFVAGILMGGFLGTQWLSHPGPEKISSTTVEALTSLGITVDSGIVPSNIFNWESILELRGFLFIVVGGFLVGFGTRYAGGCTSGHGLTGTSTLQWPSFVALAFFFAGGIFCTHVLMPLILKMK
jgi:uncharacterized membrane protein YedE/YeeE